jgi:hypothetical protein
MAKSANTNKPELATTYVWNVVLNGGGSMSVTAENSSHKGLLTGAANKMSARVMLSTLAASMSQHVWMGFEI